MKLYLLGLLQILFPLSDDEQSIAGCSVEHFVRKLALCLDEEIYSLLPFSDPQVRGAIHLVKFHNHPHACSLLGELLAQWLYSLPERQYVLIPIPLSRQRMMKRGHNQVATIAKRSLSKHPHIVLRTNILERCRHTEPQTTLARKERRSNLSGAFEIKRSEAGSIRGKHIILLDDVTTTGATLKEARKALMEYRPASVCLVALAH